MFRKIMLLNQASLLFLFWAPKKFWVLVLFTLFIIAYSQENSFSQTTDYDNVSLLSRGSNASAISEGTYEGVSHYASWAIDGDSGSSWASEWSMPAWLQVEFDQVYMIEMVGVWWGSHQHKFSIRLSMDGSNWTEVVSSRWSKNAEESAPVHELFIIPATDAKYIRIDITSTSAPSSHIFQAIVQELEAYSPNVALSTRGSSAAAISEGTYLGETHYASLAIDGDPNSSWASEWSMPAWLQIEFDQVYSIGMVGVWWGSHQHEFSISLSEDGTNWTVVVPSRLSGSSEGSAEKVHELYSIPTTEARYIRIDITSTSAPSSHIFQAIVQELEAYTNPLPNIALSFRGSSANAISEGTYLGETHYASLAIDGDPNSSWASEWSMPAWLQVEFDQVYTIGMVGVWWGSHQHAFSISLSEDGNNWTTVVPSRGSGNFEESPPVHELFPIPATEAKFIRISITSTSAPSSHIFQAIVHELEAYSVVGNPLITGVKGKTSASLPMSFDLSQNYPNPFNPTTTIRFEMPQASQVRLVIYNLSGQEVRTLVDNPYSPGQHTAVWGGQDNYGQLVSSGVYFIQMHAGEFMMMRKVLLVR